jgi:serine/threonine protein kinase
MTTQTKQCQLENITPFLNGSLDSVAHANFESHLDQCQRCREALDLAVASEYEWNEVRNSLSTDGPSSTARVDGRSETVMESADLSFYRRLLAPSDDPRMLGRIGNSEVVGLLGQGGMGVVFKAFDSSLNRYVAIKMMVPHFAASGAARQRFSREAQATGAVVHEHVIAIHCVSQWQDIPYLVMPYIPGVSLQKRIDDQGALQLRELLRIGMQVAEGLAAAHGQGLIHRDVKPANILMEEGVDRVVLTDFGLACAVDDVRLTKTDTVVGTPQYMSPEQVNDESLDFRTDLFSLGSVLYEASTGRPPFQAVTSYGVLRKIKEQQPTPIRELNPDLPDWFDRVVSRLLAKNPADRFESAAEVAILLKQCLAHVEQPLLTPLPASLAKIDSRNLTSIVWRYVMPVVLLSLAAFTVAMMMPSNPESRPDPTPPALTAGAETPGAEAAVAVAQDAGEERDRPRKKYSSAKEAYQVGVAYYNSRNYEASRGPFEAALRLAKNDGDMRLKAHEALLAAYRLIPEFEPYQKAAEYVITHHKHDAHRSITRRSYLSFAFNRGQIRNLVKQHEKQLKKDPNNWTSLYLLSEIYSGRYGLRSSVDHSKRAIELIEQLAKLEEKRVVAAGGSPKKMSAAEAVKISRQKANLARQYSQAKNYQKAAELYEETAPLDPRTHAWNLKDAAEMRLKLGDRKGALRLALAAEKAPPEARNDQLTHFFERSLGNTFLAVGEPKKAIPHYEIAIKKTKIEGYLKDTKASLQEAREKAGR